MAFCRNFGGGHRQAPDRDRRRRRKGFRAAAGGTDGPGKNNVNAIALYKKVGFEIEGVQREALVDGTYELILMGLLF